MSLMESLRSLLVLEESRGGHDSVSKNGTLQTEENKYDELAQEWALAIIIAYESGHGLKKESEDELRDLVNKCPHLKAKIIDILIEQKYGDTFKLKPMKVPKKAVHR